MKNVKKIRKSTGLSARDFGLACGLSGKNVARSVYRWENGDHEPSLMSQYLMSTMIPVSGKIGGKLWKSGHPSRNVRALVTDGSNINTAFWDPDIKMWTSENGGCLSFKPIKYREVSLNFLASEIVDF